MTRGEAIDYFKRSYALGDRGVDIQHNEALDMAIEALQEEPCEDVISRKATVKFLRNHAEDFEDVRFRMALKMTASLVGNPDNIPPVAPTQRWIPVSERLPEEGEEVLVSGNKRVVISRYQGEQYGFTCGLVSAWMPLPKPYKTEMENENDKSGVNVLHR